MNALLREIMGRNFYFAPDDGGGDGTPPVDDPANKEGGEKTEEERQAELAKKLADADVMKEVDRRVTAAVKKAQMESERKIKEAADAARRKAEEEQLLRDGKTEELYLAEKKKREELEAQFAQTERQKNIGTLLDKHNVVEPEMRKFYYSVVGELTDVDTFIADHARAMQKAIDERVAAEVSKRLGSTPPPKGKEQDGGDAVITARSQLKSDAEKAAYISKHGLAAWQKLPR